MKSKKSGSTSGFCLTNGKKKPILEAEKGALIVFTLPEKMSCAGGMEQLIFFFLSGKLHHGVFCTIYCFSAQKSH